jgi:hypothetical protein
MGINMAVPLIDNYTLLNRFSDIYTSEEPRFERKFRLRVSDSEIVPAHLINLGFLPIYSKRRVNSIYFDTAYYRFARENIDGERYRIKPRVRFYGDIDEEYNTILEYKFRDGFLGYKYKKKVDSSSLCWQDDVASIIERDIFSKVSPSIKITYDRRYFLHSSGIRATVDNNIAACNLRGGHGAKFLPVGYDVVEFKYPVKLDDYFRESIFYKFSELSPYRLNKSSKYVEGLLACQCLFG